MELHKALDCGMAVPKAQPMQSSIICNKSEASPSRIKKNHDKV